MIVRLNSIVCRDRSSFILYSISAILKTFARQLSKVSPPCQSFYYMILIPVSNFNSEKIHCCWLILLLLSSGIFLCFKLLLSAKLSFNCSKISLLKDLCQRCIVKLSNCHEISVSWLATAAKLEPCCLSYWDIWNK